MRLVFLNQRIKKFHITTKLFPAFREYLKRVEEECWKLTISTSVNYFRAAETFRRCFAQSRWKLRAISRNGERNKLTAAIQSRQQPIEISGLGGARRKIASLPLFSTCRDTFPICPVKTTRTRRSRGETKGISPCSRISSIRRQIDNLL